jgi:hypothetical protein
VIRTQPGTSPRSAPGRASLRRMGQSGQGMAGAPFGQRASWDSENRPG